MILILIIYTWYAMATFIFTKEQGFKCADENLPLVKFSE